MNHSGFWGQSRVSGFARPQKQINLTVSDIFEKSASSTGGLGQKTFLRWIFYKNSPSPQIFYFFCEFNINLKFIVPKSLFSAVTKNTSYHATSSIDKSIKLVNI
jgi:hypothetical protein